MKLVTVMHVYGGITARNKTVTMNAAPRTSAAILSRVFSITKSPK